MYGVNNYLRTRSRELTKRAESVHLRNISFWEYRFGVVVQLRISNCATRGSILSRVDMYLYFFKLYIYLFIVLLYLILIITNAFNLIYKFIRVRYASQNLI